MTMTMEKINGKTSAHYRDERKAREGVVAAIGEGKVYRRFTVDRGHPAGAEIHTITHNGIIIIHNAHTGKLITKLIARPSQIRRYFRDGERIPAHILMAAAEHVRLKLNR